MTMVSPGLSSPASIIVSQAARYGRPTAPASLMVRRSGLRDNHVSGRATNRAWVPGRIMPSCGALPQTSWPLRSPSEATTPAKSTPGIIGSGVPSRPAALAMSSGFTAAACTSTSTSPGPGSGTGSERSASDSAGGPLAWITTASISGIRNSFLSVQSQRGDCADLLEHLERVEFVPVLEEQAVADAPDVDRVHFNLRAAGRHAEERPGVPAAVRVAANYGALDGDDVVDLRPEVVEGVDERS